MTANRHIHMRIEGRVQGVGFRMFVLHQATALGLAGSVRNRRDGGVELFASGERASIEALIARVARGPRGANVDMTKVFDIDVTAFAHAGFVVGATV